MSGIYVFLGPTLAEKEARAELDAVYLPPASAGDVYRLWRERPRVIGIVDGYFDRVPAVWHKEIMWMMERGVHVFGGAGLGALRAAELDAFGMRGVGWVYRAFRDGTLDRDDEVAVRHAPAGEGYRALSEPMVNIRRTLAAAGQQGIISAATRDLLTDTAAALFYPDRTWPRLLSAAAGPAAAARPGAAGGAGAAGADAAELDALRRWLPAGRTDQQADDALAMLREIRGFLATDPAPQQVSWSMANTAMWEAARRYAGIASGDGGARSALMEKILDEIRLLGPGAFESARCRGLLRVFAAEFAERVGMTIDGERLEDAVAGFRMRHGLDQGADLAQFLAANDMSADDFERLVVADEMVRWACGQAEWDALDDLLDELRLHGEYPQLVARARAKLDLGPPPAGQAEPAEQAEQAAIRWYFAERRATPVPEDLAGYALSCGFPDEQAFRRAVGHEYRYAGAR
jgi:hypothetical protein